MSTATPSALSCVSSAENSFDALGSRPEVGSSSSRAFAFLASAIAMPTFCRMPFEYALTRSICSSGCRPTRVKNASSCVARVVGPPRERAEVLEVLEAAEILVEHHLLGDVGEVPLGLERLLRDVDPVDACRPGRRLDEVEEEVDRGRLAGAVGAEQTEHLAGLDRERQVVEGDVRIVPLRESCSLEHGFTVAAEWLKAHQ